MGGQREARDVGLDQGVRQLVRVDHGRPGGGLGLRGGPGGQALGVLALAARGVVGGQLRGQLLRTGLAGGGPGQPPRPAQLRLAGGGQGQPQRPAQLLVDVQAVDPGAAGQQAADQAEVLGAARGLGEETGPGQLVVAAGDGVAQLAQGAVGEQPAALGAPGRVGVQVDGGLRLGVQRLQHADVALLAGEAQHQGDVVAGRHQAVPGEVPDGGPGQRAGEVLADVAEAGAQGLQRVLVEADLAVGQVVVVEQHQRRAGAAGRRGDHGAGAGDVQLDPLGAHQGAVGVPVVQADRDPVRAQDPTRRSRRIIRSVLEDGQLGDPALGVGGDLRGERVDAGGLQPGGGPGLEVAAAGLLQDVQQVGELGVAEGVALEVAAGALEEGLRTGVRHQLLEDGGTLGVGDAVEVELGVLQVPDVRGDRVRGGELVLPVGPGLALVGEGDPGGGVAGAGADQAVGAHEVGEGLLQPQVVPPAHGHQVAEPHVRHLVQDDVGPALVGGVGDLRAEDELLAEGDAAGVLHRADVVLGDKGLVVLAEGVRVVELLVEEVESELGDAEDLVRVEVRGEGLAAHRGERDLQGGAVGELAAVVVAGDVVRAGDDGGEVGGDRLGRRELPGAGAAFRGDVLVRGVGPHVPGGRGGHGEGERGLQVRLFEVREHPAGVGRLVVGVEVGLAVHRVDEAVQALAGAAVGAVGLDGQLVLGGQAVHVHPGAVVGGGRVDGAAVEGDGADGGGEQVEEGVRTGPGAAEGDRGGGAEGGGRCVRRRGHVQPDPVAVHGQEAGPLLGFVAAEVLARHGGTPLSGSHGGAGLGGEVSVRGGGRARGVILSRPPPSVPLHRPPRPRRNQRRRAGVGPRGRISPCPDHLTKDDTQ